MRSRRPPLAALLGGSFAVAFFLLAAAPAHPGPDASGAVEAQEADWRFPVGERTVYDVRVALGGAAAPRPLGEARLTVEDVEAVREVPTYRVSMELEGRVPLVFRTENRQVSWVAPDPVRTLQYRERIHETNHRRDRLYHLDQEGGTFTRTDRDGDDGPYRPVEEQTDVPMPPNALDEVAFLYYVRTLPLEVGDVYELERHFEEKANPVRLEVLRRETVRVPAGRFPAIVVRPVIQTGGLFGEGGRAEVYLSDDDRRKIVQIKSRMRVGSVNFVLREWEEGDSENGFIRPNREGDRADP